MEDGSAQATTPRGTLLSASKNETGGKQEESASFADDHSAATDITPITNASVFNAPAPAPAASAPITRTDVQTIVHQTADASEQLRTTGREHVEVEVKLASGEQLTVRLQMVRGEVQPTFRTDSSALRDALQQNWSQFSNRPADGGARITTPVFEAQTQSGMSDLNQQNGRRDQAFAQAREEATMRSFTLPRGSANRTSAATAATPPSPGVQLYA